MRALVVLAVLGVCSALPAIRDTPEVAAEKARFFEVFRAAQAAAQPQTNAITQQANIPAPIQQIWTGPLAATIPAGIDGKIIPVSNTNEVAAARNEFFNTYQAQLAATVGIAPQAVAPVQPQPAPMAEAPVQIVTPVQAKWTGPVAATIPAGVPGSSPQVPDTAEVVAAKQAFFNTYQKQVVATTP
ncbi:cuticle protein CP1499-like [Panulirus ornatus]|uniref:cuticle protein CP1499-like n=1 Tax=Panulirus ornatus TaxID=150431 RepID=UPI003A8AE25C